MLKSSAVVAGLLLCAFGQAASAQETFREAWEEYDKLIKSRESVAALSFGVLGDSVDLQSGALTFSATDVSILGNGSLAVAFTRKLSVSNRKGYVRNDAPLADWDLDVPRLSGVFAQDWPDQRCTNFAVGSILVDDHYFQADEYWDGNQALMPNGGPMLKVGTNAPKPSSGGPYYWVTGDHTYFSCLSVIQNGAGEGFLAITSDGTKYRFDWMAQYVEPGLRAKNSAGQPITLSRRRNVLYATRVEDRFGNWVNYTYTNAWNAPARLTGIAASDGRQISVTYNASGHVETVSDGLASWNYLYDYTVPEQGHLKSVVLPDQSRWTISFADLASTAIRYLRTAPSSNEAWRDCFEPGDVSSSGATGSITHPSGASGEFTVMPTRHGRSNVPALCGGFSAPDNDPNDDVAYYPINWDSLSVTSKRLTGPGIEPATWTYGYYSDISWFFPDSGSGYPVCQDSSGCVQPVCSRDDCAGASVTTVTGPDGQWVRYTFGNSYRYNEGKLLKVEEGSSAIDIRKTVINIYNWAQSGQPYALPLGVSPNGRGNDFTSEFPRPQTSTATLFDGATFTSRVPLCGLVPCFDAFARPTRSIKSSSLGYAKTELTEYHDEFSSWVLGQVKRVTNVETGTVVSQTDFQPITALPLRTYAFGKLQQSRTYHPDGTVATVADGNGNVTILTGWKRGIPQNIRHPDQAIESAVVDDVGSIVSVTDENGHTTTYGYDAMRRLRDVAFPQVGTETWNNRRLVFEPVDVAEQGLPAGHWRQTITQGTSRKILYFDALWRPVVEQDEDTADSARTMRWLTRRFDASGRVAFESYPRNPHVDGWVSAGAPVNGTRTSYDVLGRVVRVEQDSELGILATTTEYLPDLKRRVTNPRGHATTTDYEAYENPDAAQPTQIQTPGAITRIVRNIFGQPTALGRW